MAGLFSTLQATNTALNAQTTAINVTSNNIANINNPNYSEETVDYTDLPMVPTAEGEQSTGITVSVSQQRSAILDQMVREEASLTGGSRSFTLRMPEIDAEGRLASKERTLNVQVPKGILPGQQIRLAGQGAKPLEPGKPGDLYIEVEFQPHPLYHVDGRDLSLELPVAPWEAALGASVKTPTPGGVVELKIPPASHAGSKLRLKGRGIPANPPGDFYVILQIALPPANDEKAKAAYAAMAAAMPFDPRAGLRL